MIVLRIVTSLVAYFVGNALTFWALAPSTPGGGQAFTASLIAIVGGIAAAIGAWWLPMWKGKSSIAPATLAYVAKGALIVGGIGFCGGFFGPMILAPGANQGPMLGIFITGPIGLVVGGIGGCLYAFTRPER